MAASVIPPAITTGTTIFFRTGLNKTVLMFEKIKKSNTPADGKTARAPSSGRELARTASPALRINESVILGLLRIRRRPPHTSAPPKAATAPPQ